MMEVANNSDSDDSIKEVTPHETALANQLRMMKAQERKKRNAETIYMVLVRNIPKTCTTDMIVKFFASEITKPVEVFLGEYGVIIPERDFALVLFQGFDNANLALIKNHQTIGNNEVHVRMITLLDAMVYWCHLRRKPATMDNSDKLLVVKVPIKVEVADVLKFLRPYDIWLPKGEQSFVMAANDTHLPQYEKIFCAVSQLAAFVIYMKKHLSPLIVDGKTMYVPVQMVSFTTALDQDTVPVERSRFPDRIGYDNVIYCSRYVQNTSFLITLKDLPPDITEREIASIFNKRILISRNNISMTLTSATKVTATILIESPEEGVFGLDNIRSFKFRNHIVEVSACRIDDF